MRAFAYHSFLLMAAVTRVLNAEANPDFEAELQAHYVGERPVPSKLFVTPDALRLDSVRLAMQVLKSHWVPTHMVALWRGGAPIGVHVHEVFLYKGYSVDHIAIRTSRSKGIGEFLPEVKVFNLRYLADVLSPDSRLLIVDDVCESGLSVKAVVDTLAKKLRANMPKDVRLAVLYDKPLPHAFSATYAVHTTDKWVSFSHELIGLHRDEIDPAVLALLECKDARSDRDAAD